MEENPSADVWQTVKGWLGWNSGGTPTQLFYEGRLITRPAGLALSMNKFFLSKIENLREKIPPAALDPLKYFKQAMIGRTCTFRIRELSLLEVKKLIKELKNSSSTGVDFLDTRTLKLSADILAPSIQHIINLSIKTANYKRYLKHKTYLFRKIRVKISLP